MLVVSDTSPLSNLAIIGRLYLLRDQFEQVWMPRAVAHELDALRNPAARKILGEAISDGWLLEKSFPATTPFPPELIGLDSGETDALRLAIAIDADHVLIDEKEARQRAEKLGLHPVGVLGVLIAAKHSGAVPSLREEIRALRTRAGFFVDGLLESRVLAIVGE